MSSIHAPLTDLLGMSPAELLELSPSSSLTTMINYLALLHLTIPQIRPGPLNPTEYCSFVTDNPAAANLALITPEPDQFIADPNPLTILQWSCTANILPEHDVFDVLIKTEPTQTALDYSLSALSSLPETGVVPIMSLLLSAGACPEVVFPHAPAPSRLAGLAVRRMSALSKCVAPWEGVRGSNAPDKLELLLEHGADPNPPDSIREGPEELQTPPIDECVYSWCPELLTILFANDALPRYSTFLAASNNGHLADLLVLAGRTRTAAFCAHLATVQSKSQKTAAAVLPPTALTTMALFAQGEPFCCKQCHKTTFSLCGGCRAVGFCCKECQQTAWKEHKAVCKHLEQARSVREESNAERGTGDKMYREIVRDAKNFVKVFGIVNDMESLPDDEAIKKYNLIKGEVEKREEASNK